MKYVVIVGSLILGIYSSLGLCVLDAKAEVGAHSILTGANTRAEIIHGNPLPIIKSGNAAASERKLFRRGQQWTAEEDQRLLALRAQQRPWSEIKEVFPQRSWRALETRYYKIRPDPPTPIKEPNFWTEEEKKLLLELVETNISWEEIAKNLPGRTVPKIQHKYLTLSKGYQIPEDANKRWTTEEDELLLEIAEARVPWTEGVAFFENRSARALKSRYERLNSPRTPSKPKGTFTTEEDDRIVEAVKLGLSMGEIARLLDRGKRTVQRQIARLRELGRLDPKGQSYTVAEFELMQEQLENGKSWDDIAAEYFPRRSRAGPGQAYRRYRARQQRGEERDSDDI